MAMTKHVHVHIHVHIHVTQGLHLSDYIHEHVEQKLANRVETNLSHEREVTDPEIVFCRRDHGGFLVICLHSKLSTICFTNNP